MKLRAGQLGSQRLAFSLQNICHHHVVTALAKSLGARAAYANGSASDCADRSVTARAAVAATP